MKKPNRNYLSFYDFLGITKPLSERPKGYSEHGPNYHDDSFLATKDMYPWSVSGYQLLGSLHPFYKIGKDIKNFFKPYPNGNKVVLDLLKPTRGIKNILKGIGSFVAGAVAFAGWAAVSPFALLGCLIPYCDIYCKTFFNQILSYPVSWMIEGIGEVIQGTTQIVTSALNFPIRLPMRGIITAMAKRSGKTFLAEDKRSIQRLAIKAYSRLDQVNPQQFYKFNEKKRKIEDVLDEILVKCKLNDYEDQGTANWLVEFLRKILPEAKTKNTSLCLLLSSIDDTLKQAQSEIRNQIKQEVNKEVQEKGKKACLLLDQVRNEILGKMNEVDVGETYAVDIATDKIRRSVAALLFEIQRKYEKAKLEGWNSGHTLSSVTSQFMDTFSFFKEKTKKDVHYLKNQDKIIPLSNIQAAKQYLSTFMPKNLVSDNLEIPPKKYYVVSRSMQTYNTSWLNEVSTSARKIQKTDIVRNLKNTGELYIFEDFKTAKRFADIYAADKNNTKKGPPSYYPPIVEVTLVDENQVIDKSCNKNFERCKEIEAGTNHLEKLLVNQETMKVTSPKNIRYISGYCHKYDDYKTWSNREKGELKNVSYTSVAKNRI